MGNHISITRYLRQCYDHGTDPITGNQEGHNISGLVGHSLAGRLSPPGDHQVIESGSSFDISCSYGTVGYSAYHRWVPARQFSLLAKVRQPVLYLCLLAFNQGNIKAKFENVKGGTVNGAFPDHPRCWP